MMTDKEQRVWQYLLANRSAPPKEVAAVCGVDEPFVKHLLDRIGTPEEIWRGEILMGYPDDNPKTAFGEAKPKLSSTPTLPIQEMGRVFELGAKKYGRFNWRLHAVSATVYYDAAQRHLMAWFDGEDTDPESGVSHLAHVMACMSILMDAENNQKLNDNRLDAEDKL